MIGAGLSALAAALMSPIRGFAQDATPDIQYFRIGNGVIMAGGVGVADHLQIGDQAVILAAAQVGGSRVAPGAVVFGYPAIPRDRFMEQLKHLYRLKRLYADVARLKARLNMTGTDAGEA